VEVLAPDPDHKRIAILYLISISFFFFVGGFFAVLMRLELMTPEGDLVQSETYNKLFTMHGLILVFFFLIPSIPAVLGNFLVPMMIRGEGPRLPEAQPALLVHLCHRRAVHALRRRRRRRRHGVDLLHAVQLDLCEHARDRGRPRGVRHGILFDPDRLNFIVTIHTMRAPGLSWFRLPLFIWAQYATSIIMLLGTPVIAITILLLALERLFRIGIFDPAIGAIRSCSSTCSGSTPIRPSTS